MEPTREQNLWLLQRAQSETLKTQTGLHFSMVDWGWVVQTLLDLLRILAWPAVTLIIAIVFRRELVGLIRRLSKVKLPGGTEVEFHELLEKAEERSPAAKQDMKDASASLETEGGKATRGAKAKRAEFASTAVASGPIKDFEELRGLAQRDPNLALAGLRIEIERMLRDMAESSLNMEHLKDARSAARLASLLTRLEMIPRSVGLLLTDVVGLCNQAVHGAEIARDDALRVISIASDFLAYYQNWATKVKPTLPK